MRFFLMFSEQVINDSNISLGKLAHLSINGDHNIIFTFKSQ